MQIDLISNIDQPPMYSICKLLSLSLFACLAHSNEVHYKIIHLIRKNFTVISRYLNKIFVTFPIPISGHDYSLFHIFRYTVIFPMPKRFFSPMFGWKNPNFKSENINEKIIVLSSKLCIKLFVYLGSRSDIFKRLSAYQSCFYDVNPLVAL